MGKPKMKWSIRALLNLKPLNPKAMSWACVEEARTDSFRDVCKSFNAMYFPSRSIASLPFNEIQVNPPDKEEDQHKEEQEEADCSDVPSSSAPTEFNQDESMAMEAMISRRFFFSPTTKSIMKHSLVDDPEQNFDENTEGDKAASNLDCHCPETKAAAQENVGFPCNEAVAMPMSSYDPYMDFRVSMEEMVMAHQLKDFPSLQELLHCYLSLNEKKTHKFIILAYLDLLMSLISQEACTESDHGKRCFPSCICLNESSIKH